MPTVQLLVTSPTTSSPLMPGLMRKEMICAHVPLALDAEGGAGGVADGGTGEGEGDGGCGIGVLVAIGISCTSAMTRRHWPPSEVSRREPPTIGAIPEGQLREIAPLAKARLSWALLVAGTLGVALGLLVLRLRR